MPFYNLSCLTDRKRDLAKEEGKQGTQGMDEVCGRRVFFFGVIPDTLSSMRCGERNEMRVSAAASGGRVRALMHDGSVNRTTVGRGAVRELA